MGTFVFQRQTFAVRTVKSQPKQVYPIMVCILNSCFPIFMITGTSGQMLYKIGPGLAVRFRHPPAPRYRVAAGTRLTVGARRHAPGEILADREKEQAKFRC